MSSANIVLGLGFGDEGKGRVTDALISPLYFSKIIIRFSGGQQAGHTVIRNGVKHIHASFGSGTLKNVPSYFTEHCTFYLNNLKNEAEVLKNEKGITFPKLYMHPLAMVTTPFDVIYNQKREKLVNHGSCGMGIFATMKRNFETGFKLYAIDLEYPKIAHQKLEQIKKYYTEKLMEYNISNAWADYKDEIDYFYSLLGKNLYLVSDYEVLKSYFELIFEGSQGIMLDMDHGIFPHVTFANTTSKNALEVCRRLNIPDEEITINYVTRCYQTRHGNGWMSNNDEIKLINNEHEINVFNDWQKNFKIGELDYDLLNYALDIDRIYSKGIKRNLIVTCLDQRPDFKFDKKKIKNYYSFSNFMFSKSPNSESPLEIDNYFLNR